MEFGKALDLAHRLIAGSVQAGDTVVDATAGKGRDTLFLARLVGPEGHVYSFDTQQSALRQTAAILEIENLGSRVSLVHSGHEDMRRYVDREVAAAMFNLGYLPGGNHAVVTRPETTTRGLMEVLPLLRQGGLVTIVIYTGHREGAAEKKALLQSCGRLSQHEFSVMHCSWINQLHNPPELIAIQKLSATTKSPLPACRKRAEIRREDGGTVPMA